MAGVEPAPRRVCEQRDPGVRGSRCAQSLEQSGEDRVAEAAALVLGHHRHVDDLKEAAAVADHPSHADRRPAAVADHHARPGACEARGGRLSGALRETGAAAQPAVLVDRRDVVGERVRVGDGHGRESSHGSGRGAR